MGWYLQPPPHTHTCGYITPHMPQEELAAALRPFGIITGGGSSTGGGGGGGGSSNGGGGGGGSSNGGGGGGGTVDRYVVSQGRRGAAVAGAGEPLQLLAHVECLLGMGPLQVRP